MENVDELSDESHDNVSDQEEYDKEIDNEEGSEFIEGYNDEYDEQFMEEITEITDEQIRSLVKIGPPILTRFEKARILGTRALQISMSAPPLLDLEESEEALLKNDPLLIAVQELEAKVLPISVRRFLPDGRYQDIPLQYLYLDWSRKSKT